MRPPLLAALLVGLACAAAPRPPASPETTPRAAARVFTHDAHTLYRLDPVAGAIGVVGELRGCGAVSDLAVNREGRLFASAHGGLFAVDPDTGDCALLHAGRAPQALAFVPRVPPDGSEVLAGYRGGEFVHIDPRGGRIERRGRLGGDLRASGDLVSVAGGSRVWVTAEGPGCTASDCLVEVDPGTGEALRNHGPLGYDRVFGLASWGDTVFGFSHRGVVFAIGLGPEGPFTTPLVPDEGSARAAFLGAASSPAAAPAPGGPAARTAME
jgi:hypothetical protein